MAGIFITVAIGVVLGGVCMVMERVYYRHFDVRGQFVNEQEAQVARSAFDKWKIHTEEVQPNTPTYKTSRYVGFALLLCIECQPYIRNCKNFGLIG